MATISKDAAVYLLRHGGKYADDPPIVRLYQYERWYWRTDERQSETCYAVFYDVRHDDMYASPFVLSYVPLWWNNQITEAGWALLQERENGIFTDHAGDDSDNS